MAKKQINNIKSKDKKEEKINDKREKDTKIKSKKFSIKITSKMKKKLKYTKNKLNIDKTKLNKIIAHIIKEEPPISKEVNDQEIEENENDSKSKEIEQEGGVSIYLYITLKKDLKDEEKRIIKNKLFKIKYSMINDIIYICLIEDKLSNEQKNKLKEITDSRLDIITKEELKNNIKNLKNIDLDNQYQIFLSNVSNNIYLNKKWDIVYYHQSKFDIIQNLVEKIYQGSTLVKLVNKSNNVLKIKFGYTNMTKDELTDNAFRIIYKTVPFVLSNAEKYNGIENIIIKTKKSIPFVVFGNINTENINFYKSE